MRYRALFVLTVSGILGFRAGMVAFPEWQTAVETAQVLAGVVHYPAATPFFLYHTKLWTVLHQVLAVLLHLGASEITLSLVMSGVLGMVSFQALSMCVFALSEDVLLAIGSPLVLAVARATDFGVVYPIALMGSVHTYGVLGLSLFVLVVSLIGAGCYRSGGFLLGIAPAVHPSLGTWLLVIVAVAFVWDFGRMREASAHGLRYFVVGCLVTGVSLVVHFTSAFPAPPVNPAVSARYLSSFVALWDAHRQPVALSASGMSLNRGALALGLLWLVAFGSDLPRSAAFLLRVVVVAAVASLLLVIASWVAPENLPATLLILMPARVANFNAMTFVALLLGIVGAYRRRPWSPVLALWLSASLLLSDRSLLWRWLQQGTGTRRAPSWTAWFDFWNVLELVSLALVTLTLMAWSARSTRDAPPRALRAVAFSARVALAVLFTLLAIAGWRTAARRAPLFDNYDTSPVFHEASRERGLLITGGNLNLIQLRTRRPVLLNGGGLDGLPYAIDSGPEVERILRDVYDIDFFNPPEEARHTGIMPNRYNQEAWERFTPRNGAPFDTSTRRDTYSRTPRGR